MRAFRGRAVVASALPEEAERLRRMPEAAGFREIICVSDGLSALRQAQEGLTDLILADAVLPVLDGPAMAARLRSLPLTVHPAVILTAVPGICPKNADLALDKPVSPEAFEAALESFRPERREVPIEKRKAARRLLDSVGVPEHPGREYLLRAIEIVWLDSRLLRSMGARLVPAVAERFGADAKSVSRAMRHVIDEAWRGGEMEAQYKLFGDTIDAARGSPTLSEMIARIADILRWEGKA